MAKHLRRRARESKNSLDVYLHWAVHKKGGPNPVQREAFVSSDPLQGFVRRRGLNARRTRRARCGVEVCWHSAESSARSFGRIR